MKMRTTVFFLTVILLSGCASKSKNCPDIGEEPVSTCRAQEKCRQKKNSYRVGLGTGLGADMGAGIAPQSQNVENYNSCVDGDLRFQRTMSSDEPGK